MKIDWKLKGSNLLKFGCGKDVTVHPETCSDVVLMGHNGSQSLTDWITKDQTNPSLGSSLTDWITNIFIKTVDDETQFIINADYAPASEGWDETNSFLLGTLNNEDEIRVPYGSAGSYGVFKVGEGLQATNGVLAVKIANTTEFGGFKLYQATDVLPSNYVRLQLDANGKAYADLSELSIENYLQDWSGANLTYAARVYNNISDSLGNIDLAEDYGTTFVDYFNGITTPTADRMYPIRADKRGRLYAYVNWVNTTYNAFSGTAAGLTPNANSVTNKATKYLNANGEWATPTNTTYGTFTTTVDGLVPKSTTNTAKFLRGDGNWAVPTDTTYDMAMKANPAGLLGVSDQIADVTCDLVNPTPIATDPLMVPIVYNEGIKVHGVMLNTIIEALVENNDLLDALKAAINARP